VLQGAVGFGANLLAAPLLVLIDPDLVPGSMLVSALALGLMMIARERSAFDRREVIVVMSGRVPGTAVGAGALVVLTSHALGILFGVLILLAVLLSLAPIHFRPTTASLVVAGTFSGFMATTIGVGGPPVALVYQRAKGPVLRSTLAMLFVLGGILSLTTLTLVGELSAAQAGAGLLLVPGAILGFALSSRLTPWLDRGWTRPAVLAVSAASAVAVLVKELA
jgi:uncharacterized membrane protein YfcA